MRIIDAVSTLDYPKKGMIASLCTDDVLARSSADELVAKIRAVQFVHKASTPDDDDEYWAAQSPFDGK